jgi:hypothetical protein
MGMLGEAMAGTLISQEKALHRTEFGYHIGMVRDLGWDNFDGV